MKSPFYIRLPYPFFSFAAREKISIRRRLLICHFLGICAKIRKKNERPFRAAAKGRGVRWMPTKKDDYFIDSLAGALTEQAPEKPHWTERQQQTFALLRTEQEKLAALCEQALDQGRPLNSPEILAQNQVITQMLNDGQLAALRAWLDDEQPNK